MNTGKAFLGILAGLAAGVTIGVLFAPVKGSKTRKRIGRKGEDLVDAINDSIDEKFDELLGAMRKSDKSGQMNNTKESAE